MGILWMPTLKIWQHTAIFSRNAMAHELTKHTTNSGSRSISDYPCFMDDLINTKEDVALLVKNEIIQNCLEPDQALCHQANIVVKGT